MFVMLPEVRSYHGLWNYLTVRSHRQVATNRHGAITSQM